MLRCKAVTVLTLMLLLFIEASPAFSQLLTDAYALAETKTDMPATWEPWLIYDNRRVESATQSDHHWVGRGERGKKPYEPQKRKCGSGEIMVRICRSATEARSEVEDWLNPARVAVPPVRGSYSGFSLGDECVRSQTNPNSAHLRFCRANVFFVVSVQGHTGCFNYPAVAEKIARAMLARADAALTLAATDSGPMTTSSRNVGTRKPRGVPVMLVDEWTAEAAATWQPDFTSGIAIVKRGSHTLRLMVGRRDAQLDGKPITLPFPALRHGKDRLWCPVAVLSKLTD